jgi:hypothetical protein
VGFGAGDAALVAFVLQFLVPRRIEVLARVTASEIVDVIIVVSRRPIRAACGDPGPALLARQRADEDTQPEEGCRAG